MILRGSQRLKGPHLLFALHLISGGKLDVCERVDLFFGLHLILAEKLYVCVRVDVFFFGVRLILVIFVVSATTNC